METVGDAEIPSKRGESTVPHIEEGSRKTSRTGGATAMNTDRNKVALERSNALELALKGDGL